MSRKTYKIVCVVGLLLITQWVLAQRDTVSLNFGWQFQLNDSVFKESVQTVNLPHDFQIGQPWIAPDKNERPDHSDMAANVRSRLSSRGFKEMGVGWYRKMLRAEKAWQGKRIVLDFGGIMLVGDVYLNGKRIGGTEYGYVGFELDITHLIDWDAENEIVVRADTRNPENSRWYTGGGLIRGVNLITYPKDSYFVRHPLHITTQLDGKVAIASEVYMDDKQRKEAVFCARIFDAQGNEVAAGRTCYPYDRRRKLRIYQLDTLQVQHPTLWSCEQPYLYTAEVTLYGNDGQVLDKVTERFGIRSIAYDPSYGFKLNGKKVLLKGIANHHDLGALGAAAYPRGIEKRIKLLKDFGFNHIRASHNPYSEEFYHLCDEYGILVVDELYDKWLTRYAGGRTDWMNLWQYDVVEWVKAHRNHPSVIMWSLGNELQTYADLPFNDYGVTPYRLQRELLHTYDTSRPVTVAMHPRGRSFETDSIPCELAKITDIQAYNYRYMYFPGDGKRYPYMNFYQSEANRSAMGPNFFEMDLNRVIGLAYWGMIDYIGESRGWPAKGWTDGVFDRALNPKPLAWFLKSMFTDEPVVHLSVVEDRTEDMVWNGVQFTGDVMTGHWNREPGKAYTLYAYTNADEVELLVNGKSLGVKPNDKRNPKTRNKIKWENVVYQPGNIQAIARTDRKVVARYKVETAGKVAKIKLEPEAINWKADGMDLQHIRVTAVDSKGRQVPMENGSVSFTVSPGAEIVAVDNGDMTSHEINTLPHIQMHRGTALVVIRAGHQPGKVQLRAELNSKNVNKKIAAKCELTLQ